MQNLQEAGEFISISNLTLFVSKLYLVSLLKGKPKTNLYVAKQTKNMAKCGELNGVN